MSQLATVAIHPTQFPAAVRQDLLQSLRSRKLNHKFLYDTLKQTQKWLALHQACSPSRTDPDCSAVYQQSFIEVAQKRGPNRVHLIGLGCGGGQKDATLLKLLHGSGNEVFYTPCDVGIPMVLTARQSAVEAVPGIKCFPFVCDLATARDLASVLGSRTGVAEPSPVAQVHHVFTFFGMMPNFEPGIILPQLAGLIEPGAQLLLSANLAPGPHYATGVEKVLPLYDNALTRDWLMSFLLDLGVEKTDGELNFTIEELSALVPLRRIAAYFHFERDRLVELDTERVDFRAGEAIRLFFSYRHTPALIQGLLNPHGLTVLKQWVTGSQEEGVFLVKKV